MIIFVQPRKYFLQQNSKSIQNILKQYFIISINTPEYKPKNIKRQNPPFPQQFLNNNKILTLYFHDWWIKNYKQVVYFNEDMAKQIHQFIDQNNVEKLIVHCTVGFSRSAAVGYILNEYYNNLIDKNDYYQKFLNQYQSSTKPNKLVVDLLMKEYNLKYVDEIEQVNNIKYKNRKIVINK